MTAPYKFQITINALQKWVFPVGVDKLVYKFDQENKEIFFRKKLGSPLIFQNDIGNGIDDFNFFRSIEQSPTMCTEIKIEIFKLCSGNYVSDYKGWFTTSMGSFDLDACEFTITPPPDDAYRCILANLNKEINILDAPNVYTSYAGLDTGSVFEYAYARMAIGDLCAYHFASLPAPTNSWTLFHHIRDYDINGDEICIYYREKIITNCSQGIPVPPPGAGWQLMSDDCAASGEATWVRQPPSVNIPNLNVVAGICDGGIPQPPPPLKTKTVTLVNTGMAGTVNDVRGFKTICLVGASGAGVDFSYDIDSFQSPSSTHLWSVTGFHLAVSGSATGTSVVIHYDSTFTSGSVICTETTACGDVIVHSQAINTGLLTASGRMFTGPKYVCKDQIATWDLLSVYNISGASRYLNRPGYFNILIGGGPNNVPLSLYGTVLVNTKTQLSVQFNSILPASGFAYEMHWTGEYLCGTTHYVVDDEQDVVITNTPLTDDITGPSPCCSSESGVIYRVEERPGSTYTWTVDGGTIISGAGTNEIEVDWGGVPGDYLISVKEDIDCGCAYTLIIDCDGTNNTPYYLCPEVTFNVAYDNNRSLPEVIEYMLSQLGCGDLTGDLISDLFEWNPDGTAPGYLAGRNYVYGGINDYANLMIAQKSDVISPTASNPATKGIWTFSKMFDYFRAFEIYWFVDGSGNLRIEHDKFFVFPIGLNLTNPQYTRQVKAQNKYSHDTSTLPKYERWKMESLFQDFVGTEILYDFLCVSQDEKSNVVNNDIADVCTDLNYIALEPENIDKNGFVIMSCDGNDNVIARTGILSGISYANQPMSISMMQDRFCRYNRYLPKGMMNNVLTSFVTFRPNVKQVDLNIPLCCDYFNPDFNVITELGMTHLNNAMGRVMTAQYELKTGNLMLKLGYSYANL